MIRDKSNRTSKTASKKKPAEPAKPDKRVIVVTRPSFRRERALIKRGVWPVAGCDEA
ncbi:ribonuclease HII, partial [Bradyrhizobium sp. Arg62]|nr:ribonuclease HII [Bradyrhizobium brasilense]